MCDPLYHEEMREFDTYEGEEYGSEIAEWLGIHHAIIPRARLSKATTPSAIHNQNETLS